MLYGLTFDTKVDNPKNRTCGPLLGRYTSSIGFAN